MKADSLSVLQLIVTDLHEKVDEARIFAEQNKEDINKELELLLDKQGYIQQLTDQIFPEGIRAHRTFTQEYQMRITVWDERKCRVRFFEAYPGARRKESSAGLPVAARPLGFGFAVGGARRSS